MRVMRTRFAWLILAFLAMPATLRAQAQEVPPVDFTAFWSHPRYEDGGFYCAIQGLYWRETRPLRNETVAYRGFIDVDGSITNRPGQFVGSGTAALNTQQL